MDGGPTGGLPALSDTDLRRVVVVSVTALTLLLVWVELIGPFPGDQGLLRWSFGIHDRTTLASAARSLRALGTPVGALVTVAILAAVAAEAGRRHDVVVILGASMAVVANLVLRSVVGPTPPFVSGTHGDGHNFPSGHTAYAAAVFGAIVVLWWPQRPGATPWSAAFLVPAVLMGPASIITSTHLLSDVLAGYCLGIAWLAAVLLATRRYGPAAS
jgi:membrane-associated phospholipid phosphatase